MRHVSLAIVGIDHPNKRGPTRRFELAICLPGEPLDLIPEPKNLHDEYAVAVYSQRGVQLGYITAERAPWIGAQIRQGRVMTAVFQALDDKIGWLRLAFDGEVPTLPPPPKPKPVIDDSGFWPDEPSGDWGA